jgi:hypothetical protein
MFAEKKFSFLVKYHLNDVLDRAVRRCFTGKNEGNGSKKSVRLRSLTD